MRQQLLSAIGHRVLDYLARGGAAEREPAIASTAEVNSSPQARGGVLLRPRIEDVRVAWEQIREHRPHRSACTGMPRWVVRNRIGRNDGGNGCIELVGARGPIEVLGVPACDRGVVTGNAHQRVGTRRTRWVRVNSVLQKLMGELGE